jgi:NAD(P)-dependent dehydrogenase (short-subunit alcohol dehydrogenase family)
VLAARTAAKLSDAAQQIAALNLSAQTLEVVTDISKAEDCKNLIEKTVVAFGRVDALINSAYIPGKFGTWERWDFDDWRKAMDVNFYGSLMLSREAAKVMKSQARARRHCDGELYVHQKNCRRAGRLRHLKSRIGNGD